MSTETRTTSQVNDRAHTRTHRSLVVVGAVAAALAVWTLADPVAGVDLAVRRGGALDQVGPGAVAAASLLAGLAAWGLLAALERFVKRPRRAWTNTAVASLALSLVGPLGSDTGTASKMTLAGMHLIVGAVLLIGLRPPRDLG
jgi:hypothetical protein